MKKHGAAELRAQIKRAGVSLHDDVAPLLAGAGLQLQILRMDYPETAPQVTEILKTLEGAMDCVRKLSQEMSPSPLAPVDP